MRAARITQAARRPMTDRSHVPVLLHEVIHLLHPVPGDTVLDGTLGLGGHAAELLKRISPGGTLIATDLDPTRIEAVRKELEEVVRAHKLDVALQLDHGSYAGLAAILQKEGKKADAVLLDLGFASDQLEDGRGLSFKTAEPLRMTYDPDATPVSELLNDVEEEELTRLLREYGEERYAGRIAHAIVKHRPILSTGRLSEVVTQAVPGSYEGGRISPATRTFQALRIWANRELENLQEFLDSVPQLMNRGGRLGIISFHSLEDRIVKNAFRDFAKQGKAELLTKKPVGAREEEVGGNPRSRSAKLRAIQWIQQETP